MRRVALLLAAGLACVAYLAGAAQAQTPTPTARVDVATSWEAGASVASFFLGDFAGSSSGSPSIVPTPGPDSGDDYSLLCSPASGANCYIERNITATGTLGALVVIRVDAAPSTARRFIRFWSNADSKTGGFVTIQASGTGYKLKTYFESTGDECSASQNDGTECTSTSQCVSAQVGESQCGDSAYAQTAALTFGTWYKIALGQANNLDGAGAGAVKLELHIDALPRGSQTKPQGACAGGSSAGYACKLDADCPSSTCTTTDVTTIDRVRVGLDDSASGGATYLIDTFAVQTNILSALKRARVEPLYPNADGSDTTGWGSGTGCANWWECVDDLASGAPDGDTSYIATVNPSAGTDRSFALSNPAALGTGEAFLGVATTAVGNKTSVATRETATGIISSGTADLGTVVDWDSFANTTDYYAASYSWAPLNPNGSVAWNATSVNAAEVEIQTGTGNATRRATALVAEALISQPLPDVPSTLSDQNADAAITVCWLGDSRLFDELLASGLNTLLEQPDNLLKCSRGATTTLDGWGKIDSILDGASAGGCVAKRGLLNSKCDYLILDYGVNDGFHRQPNHPRAGYCYDNGGPNQGNPCFAEVEHSFDSPPLSYCTRGSAFRATCTPTAGTPCTGETGSSLVCDHTSGSALPCQPGKLDATGCPTGVCVRDYNLAAHFRRKEALFRKIDAHASNAKVVFVLPADTCESGCGAISGCAAGTCVGCWGAAADALGAMRAHYKLAATRYGWNWVDMNAEFRRRCSPWQACLRDAVHWSTSANGDNPTGNDVAAELLAECLEDPEGDATNTSCANR